MREGPGARPGVKEGPGARPGEREAVDVVLLLEGTYPFVPGGVSSWVHGIVSGMPDLSFGLIFLGAAYEPREAKYTLPPNVKFLSEWSVYDYVPHRFPPRLSDGSKRSTGEFRPKGREALAAVEQLCFDLQDGHMASFDAVWEVLEARLLSLRDLAYGPPAWELKRRVYEKKAPEISFLDFFWTWRFAYLPVFNTFYADLPPAKLYHTICTGWGGLLGTIAKKRYGRPLLLTEHGIYLNERRIEISQSEWIYAKEEDTLTVRRELGYFKELWIRLFEATARLCYERCDAIYTLYDGNRRMQIEFGAPADRIEVIPNGVDVGSLTPPPEALAARENPGRPPRVGFVGRVVPIKDVKTLIRACRLVANEIPNVEVLILGPTEEDPRYFAECQKLAAMLGLGETVKFMGRVNVREYYPTLDVQVLTSISEGQPLVILEGYCVGVPVVATQVGACREIIEGVEPEDRDLGPSGIVTRIGNPEETGSAILKILRDAALRRAMGDAARERVRRFYDYKEMIARYRGIYERFRTAPDFAGGAPGGSKLLERVGGR